MKYFKTDWGLCNLLDMDVLMSISTNQISIQLVINKAKESDQWQLNVSVAVFFVLLISFLILRH